MRHDADDFFWVGNHPGLDLVNTEAVDARGDRLELVTDVAELVDWATAAELIDADLAEPCRAAGERRAHVSCWTGSVGCAAPCVASSNPPTMQAPMPSMRLWLRSRCGSGTGPATASTTAPLDAAEPLDRLRLAIATAALEATRLDRSRVRRCGNERCVLLYFDTTKNRSRRWCDMAVCGNRAKASAHYRRHHTSGE